MAGSIELEVPMIKILEIALYAGKNKPQMVSQSSGLFCKADVTHLNVKLLEHGKDN